MEKEHIKKLYWQDVRDKVATVNPILAKTIDSIDPSNKFPLYLVRYFYGNTITEHGIFHLPFSRKQTIPITDPNICVEIKKDFLYAIPGSPVGILLKNTVEESAENFRGEYVPSLVRRTGTVLWLWDRLDKNPLYSPYKMFSLTAGARCIFMLPNICDIALHKNLKRDFNVRLQPPKSLFDQWEIFKTILHHPEVNCDWMWRFFFYQRNG